MLERLIRFNKYPRKTIQDFTGVYPAKQSVVCVGNTMERVRLEKHILMRQPVILLGKGKMTAVLEIVDRLNLGYHISYNGDTDWGSISDTDDVFIVRFDRLNTSLKQYAKESCRLVLLCDKEPELKLPKIVLQPLTKRDMDEYLSLKGMPMIVTPRPSEPKSEKQIIMDSLRTGIAPESMPPYMEQWYARNLYTSDEAIRLITKAQTSSPLFKWGLLNLIRVKRPIDLKPPVWVKMK